jgi:N-carbamoylputrescine amidase
MPRLALLQSRSYPTKAEAFTHHEALIREAARGGAQIIVTQELFLTPYFCTVEDPALFDYADPLPGPVTERLGRLAQELGVVLISSLFEHRGPGLYHNTAAGCIGRATFRRIRPSRKSSTSLPATLAGRSGTRVSGRSAC